MESWEQGATYIPWYHTPHIPQTSHSCIPHTYTTYFTHTSHVPCHTYTHTLSIIHKHTTSTTHIVQVLLISYVHTHTINHMWISHTHTTHTPFIPHIHTTYHTHTHIRLLCLPPPRVQLCPRGFGPPLSRADSAFLEGNNNIIFLWTHEPLIFLKIPWTILKI